MTNATIRAQTQPRFTSGDIYLLSENIPGVGEGIVRIVNGGPSLLVDLNTRPESSLSYDAFRDKLIVIASGSVRGVDVTGNLETIAIPFDTPKFASARGDGIIYTFNTSTGFCYLDAVGNEHTLDGANPSLGSELYEMFYDSGSNALFLAGTAANPYCSGDRWSTCVIKVPLDDTGTNVEGTIQSIEKNVSTTGLLPSEGPVGLSYGPGDDMFLVVDTNSNSKEPRMLTFSPNSMASLDVYASSGPYPGAAVVNAGLYSNGQGLILDTFNDVIRAYEKGDEGSGIVYATGVSGIGTFGERAQMVKISEFTGGPANQPPVADAGVYYAIECLTHSGAEMTLDGSGSFDPDGDELTFTWRENGNIIAGPTTSPTSDVMISLGNHPIELTVDDGKGGTDTDLVEIDVVDTSAPSITISISPDLLWPPNHKMRDITATVTVSDGCDANASFVLLSITSNEPEEGSGKNHSPDIMGADFGTADTEFELRAERFGNGDGRVYTITYEATDALGNTGLAIATAEVPHNMSKLPAHLVTQTIPDEFVLFDNYPNPFNPTTTIAFALPEATEVSLIIYNLSGQIVRELVSGQLSVGVHRVIWNATDDSGIHIASGVYLYVLQAGSRIIKKKLAFMK